MFIITCVYNNILISLQAQDGITSPSPSFNNSNLTHNIGFAVSSPQNIGFNLPSSTATTFSTSNGFNGTGLGFNNFPTQNNGNAAASPLSDLDEFDVITNRGKLGASPQTVNNGT